MYIIPRPEVYNEIDINEFARDMDLDMNAYFEEKEALLENDGISQEYKANFIHPKLFCFHIAATKQQEWGIFLAVNGSDSSNDILVKKVQGTYEEAEEELERIVTTGVVNA